MHGWEEEDYLFTHNHGRGGLFYDFRQFVLRNMGYRQDELFWKMRMFEDQKRRHRIVFSQNSSELYNRRMSFNSTMNLLREKFPDDYLRVEGYTFRHYTAAEQLDIVHDASIFVTLCGGGAMSGMFLPAGSSVFIIYAEDGGAKNNRSTKKPALLDWDLFNAMSHLLVHWLPRNTMKSGLDQEFFVELVRHELRLMDSGVFDSRAIA